MTQNMTRTRRSLRGQFQILTALALAALMITAMSMTVSDYSVNLRDVDAEVTSIRAQTNRAVLAAIAFASNGDPGNVDLNFRSALNSSLMSVSAVNYGLLVTAGASSADLYWNSPTGDTICSATVNVEADQLKATWNMVINADLKQAFINSTTSYSFRTLITFHVLTNVTLNGFGARWLNGTALYQNNVSPVYIEKNYGNGLLLLTFSFSYSGTPGTYPITLVTWDANMIEVRSEFNLYG